MDLADNVIETDVLIIGGGVAGCIAAVKATEHGADVTMLDKAAIRRSGGAASGMDHIATIPNAGITITDIVTQVCDDGVYPPHICEEGPHQPKPLLHGMEGHQEKVG